MGEQASTQIPKSPEAELSTSFEKSREANDLSLRDESLAESFQSMNNNPAKSVFYLACTFLPFFVIVLLVKNNNCFAHS